MHSKLVAEKFWLEKILLLTFDLLSVMMITSFCDPKEECPNSLNTRYKANFFWCQ